VASIGSSSATIWRKHLNRARGTDGRQLAIKVCMYI
jgi:hypothetical protein